MRNINLIPKVPRIRRIFIPVMLTIVSTSVSLAAALLLYGAHLQNSVQDKEKESTQLAASIQAITQQKRMDNQTRDYQQFLAEVTKLKQDRRLWLPLLELTTAQLPEVARIISINVTSGVNDGKQTNAAEKQNKPTGNDQRLVIAAEFGQLDQAAEYAFRLQQSPLLGNVVIKSIQRIDDVVPVRVIPTASAAAPPINEISPAQTKEDLISKLLNEIPPAESKGDELLNQLRWMMNQQMANQQLGIELPDKNFVVPDSSMPGKKSIDQAASGTAITQKEINEARKQLEQFKNQQTVTDSNTALAPKTPTPPAAQPVQKYTKYQVQLELTIKQPVKEK